jgi:hypothetical protein
MQVADAVERAIPMRKLTMTMMGHRPGGADVDRLTGEEQRVAGTAVVAAAQADEGEQGRGDEEQADQGARHARGGHEEIVAPIRDHSRGGGASGAPSSSGRPRDPG